MSRSDVFQDGPHASLGDENGYPGLILWTDGMVILQHIKNCTKCFQNFVANRILVIHDGSSHVQWKHVSSEGNPADDASRGLRVQEMITMVR